MRRVTVVAMALAAAMAFLACDGSARGHGVKSQEISGDSGRASGAYAAVTGRFTHRVQGVRIAAGSAVKVQARFAVQKGSLEVSVTSPDGQVSKATAQPSQPADLSGVTTMGGNERLPVVLQAGGGQAAEGVEYTIRWER